MTTNIPTTVPPVDDLSSTASYALFIADKASWLQERVTLAASKCPF